MSSLVKNIIRFILFILVQVFVFNQIPPLHHLINPYVYFLFILWLPFKIGRKSLMILALALGLALDYFTKTPGLHAAGHRREDTQGRRVRRHQAPGDRVRKPHRQCVEIHRQTF